MPNHITNILKFNGDKQKIEQLLKDISPDANENEIEETAYIDFNKIIPMPESYKGLVSGSVTDTSVAVYMAVERKNYEKIDKIKAYPGYKSLKSKTREEFIEYLIESQGATVELGKQYVDNYEKYGAYTWYDWSCDNWGTKWNAYDQYFSEENNEIIFNTAWNGVPKLIQLISERYPEIEIEYKYADEDFGCNLAKLKFLAGKIKEEYYPKCCSSEAYELAEEILGYNPFDEDDYDYDEEDDKE
jgi:hypothetical protein